MNWEAIGAIGEVTASILVGATLLILVLQSRQESRQRRITNQIQSLHQYLAHIQDLFSDPKKLTTFRHGLDSYNALEDDDKALFQSIMLGFFSHYIKGLEQIEMNMIREEDLAGIEADFVRILSCPGCHEWWKSVSASFGNDSRVESLLDRGDSSQTIREVLGIFTS